MRRPEDLPIGVVVRMLPWALLLPVLKRLIPISRLVGLMARRPPWPVAQKDTPEIARAAWLASRVQFWRFPDNCLERSLVTYRFLGLSGLDPTLVLGASAGGERV